MKVNAIVLMVILFAATSLSASTGTAQTLADVKVTVEVKKGTVRAVLSQIEQQSDFRFAYPNELLSSANSLNIPQRNLSVEDALNLALRGTGLGYKQMNNSVILFKQPKLSAAAVVQQITVQGMVTDESNSPLPGVSVKVKNSASAVSTDNNGRFSIQVSDESAILVFTYVGYVNAERSVRNSRTINISLKQDISSLDAVVVIGYGTTTKRANTGSVTTVGSKDIANQPVTDPIAALQGRVAGLEISAVTGYPGSGYNVRLRGDNSIGAGSEPYYIVDGIPFISESLSQISGANGSQSPLASINPADIEQIDILKDADATAIYGSRAANGVILITTKKGRAGKPEISINAYTGLAKADNPVKMLNTQQYLELRREAYKNDGVTPTETNAPDLLVWDQNVGQNWQERLIGNSAPMTEINASIRGGSEQTNFLFSGTVRDEQTVLPGDFSYLRGALNMSINHNSIDNKLKIAGSVKYTTDDNNTLATDLTSYFNLPPNMPIYNPDGTYFWYGNEQNPIAYLDRKSRSKTQNIFGDASIAYIAAKGLTLKVTGGFNSMNMNQVQTFPKVTFNPQNYTGSLGYYGNAYLRSYIIEPQAEYALQLGKGTLTALAGSSFQQSLREGQSTEGNGYSSDEQLENIRAATTFRARGFNYRKYRYASLFGRLTYNFDQKYIINGTFRRDGSSRFGPDKKFGNFGAIGAAWVFSNEDFIKQNLGFLSFAKLRGSYGVVGNDQIGDYEYLDTWSSTSYSYGGFTGLAPTRFAIPTYSWEETWKLEGGLDLGFLNERILLTTNVYRNRSDNQLIDYTLSPQSGFTGFTANLPALVENTGVEFELFSNNIMKDNFSWSTSLNMTFSKNRLLEYDNIESSSYANTYVVGKSLSIVKGYQFTGIDPQTGVPTFMDIDNDQAVSTPADDIVMGQTMPSFFAGMQNSLTYRKLSLDLFFQFVKQEGTGLNYGYLSYSNGIMKNKDISALNRWRTAGDPASVPGASATSGTPIYSAYQNLYRLSDANWVDASFIRLKNVSLRYNFGSLLSKWGVNNFTVYVQGQNLFTITSYDGFDPETRAYSLPPLAVYTAGLRVSF